MRAEFVISGTDPARLGEVGDAEIGVIGRSNVGKSSLLNGIMGARGLVRVSRTPGRTRLMNQFLWNKTLSLVDLPGYGFAKASKTDQAAMRDVIGRYVTAKRAHGMALLVDIRRVDVSPLDKQALDVILEASVPLLLVCTKADQVPKNRRLNHVRKIEKSLEVDPGCAIAVSSKTGEGMVELRRRLLEVRNWGE